MFTASTNTAGLYLFRTDDGLTAKERLLQSADAYAKAVSMDLNSPDMNKDPEYLWQIARTEKGKPYFPHYPALHFSITHSGGYWLGAFSGQPIGVDLQKHTRKQGETEEAAAARFCRMARRFFHLEEASFVLAPLESSSAEAIRRFFRIWSAKESYVKYTGSGIDRNFGKFSVLPEGEDLSFCGSDDPIPGVSKSFSLNHCWQAAGAWFQEIKAVEDYSLCICTECSCHTLFNFNQ